MLPALEVYFKTSVNVYSLGEDGKADVVRISKVNYDLMHLNLYQEHFSYIKDFPKYAKQFRCVNCERVLSRNVNLRNHVKTCSIESEECYRGGKYRNRKNVFDQLENVGIDVPKELRYTTNFAVYDFEALQVPVMEESKGRIICFEHVPATLSV